MSETQPTAPQPCLGTMFFGTTVDEATSFDILDRYVAAGGTMLDTANNYAFWAFDDATGDESESLLGRWLAARDNRSQVQLATKLGARPNPGSRSTSDAEGLSADAIRSQVAGSLERLGTDKIDLLYAHIDDESVPLEETLGAFDELVSAGTVGLVGASNYTADRLRAAHDVSAAHDVVRYSALQSRSSYLTPRPDADFGVQILLDDELAEYAAEQNVRVFGYSSLLAGLYSRPDKAIPDEYVHDTTDAQSDAVRSTAERLGCTPSQVVYAWTYAQGITPVLGISTVAQLDEALAAGPELLDDQAHSDLAAARGQ